MTLAYLNRVSWGSLILSLIIQVEFPMRIGRIVNTKRSANLFINKFIDFHLKHMKLLGESYKVDYGVTSNIYFYHVVYSV